MPQSTPNIWHINYPRRRLANEEEYLLKFETIPSLLERIGDDEDNVIDAIMLAVKYARYGAA